MHYHITIQRNSGVGVLTDKYHTDSWKVAKDLLNHYDDNVIKVDIHTVPNCRDRNSSSFQEVNY